MSDNKAENTNNSGEVNNGNKTLFQKCLNLIEELIVGDDNIKRVKDLFILSYKSTINSVNYSLGCLKGKLSISRDILNRSSLEIILFCCIFCQEFCIRKEHSDKYGDIIPGFIMKDIFLNKINEFIYTDQDNEYSVFIEMDDIIQNLGLKKEDFPNSYLFDHFNFKLLNNIVLKSEGEEPKSKKRKLDESEDHQYLISENNQLKKDNKNLFYLNQDLIYKLNDTEDHLNNVILNHRPVFQENESLKNNNLQLSQHCKELTINNENLFRRNKELTQKVSDDELLIKKLTYQIAKLDEKLNCIESNTKFLYGTPSLQQPYISMHQPQPQQYQQHNHNTQQVLNYAHQVYGYANNQPTNTVVDPRMRI